MKKKKQCKLSWIFTITGIIFIIIGLSIVSSQVDKMHKDANIFNIGGLSNDTGEAGVGSILFILGLIILLPSIISLLICKFRK